MQRPFASAADENRQVILQALRPYLRGRVLEIGSGTGQHAVYFCEQLPELHWQTSELPQNLAGIQAWIDASALANLEPPLALDVCGVWPDARYDTVYSANCFHIMSQRAVSRAIAGGAACLQPGGYFAVYGPFNYGGAFTSASNERFDAMLKAGDPASGIRDFEWLDQLAQAAGMDLAQDIEMPANNRCLVWKKRTIQSVPGLTG